MGTPQTKTSSPDRVFDSSVQAAIEDFIATIAIEAMAGRKDFAEGLAAVGREVAALKAKVEWLDGILNPPQVDCPGLEGQPLQPEDRVVAIVSRLGRKASARKDGGGSQIQRGQK
jgi:hypothetical protein